MSNSIGSWIHTDSLSNVVNSIENRLTGLGQSGYDSISELEINESWIYQNTRFLFDCFYHNIWQVRRIVDMRPNQMSSAWGEFALETGDQTKIDDINDWLNGLRGIYKEGQMLANKDGCGFVIRLVDDGQEDFSQPIDYDNVKKVRYSRTFDRWEIYPHPDSYFRDVYDPEYYLIAVDPEEDVLNPMFGQTRVPDGTIFQENLSYFKIHKSRVIRFNGKFLNSHAIKRNHGCHASILPEFLQPMMRYVVAINHVGEATKSFEVVMFLIENLNQMLKTKPGEEAFKTRMLTNNAALSSMRAYVGDKSNEDMQLFSRNFSNIDNILQELRLEMQGAADMDAVELYQIHPSGMQATGQSQRLEKAFKIMNLCVEKYDENLVGSRLKDKVGDIELFLLSDESPFDSGLKKGEWSWKWNSSINLTPEEESEIRKRMAETDKINIDTEIYGASEARQRHMSVKFSTSLVLQSEKMPEEDVARINEKMIFKEKMIMEQKQMSEKEEKGKEPPKDTKNDAVEKFRPLIGTVIPDSDYDRIIQEIGEEN